MAVLLFSGALCALVFCDGGAPAKVRPHIEAVMPHDTAAFTQGLFYDGGLLYESDGLYEKSRLRVIDAASGAVKREIPLDRRYFAEGCAKLGETLVQLSWREQTALVWSLPALSPGQPLMYSGEGWGLASDGRRFYMSDGSDTVFVRSADFTIERKLPVTSLGMPVKNLNELEFVKGKLYANVWYQDIIVEINPGSGRVSRIIDCSDMVKQEQPNSSECVLNGIAYNPQSGCFYITGKKWKKLFVVRLPE